MTAHPEPVARGAQTGEDIDRPATDAWLPLGDIVADAALPECHAEKLRPKDFHGKISWSVRAFAAGTPGRCDGNPAQAGTFSSRERARHMEGPAVSTDALMSAAETEREPRCRLELRDRLVAFQSPAGKPEAGMLADHAEAAVNASVLASCLWKAESLRRESGDDP